MFNRNDYLSPKLLQALGFALLLAQVVFWMFTGHSQTLFIGPCLGLIFLGQYRETAQQIRGSHSRDGDETEETETREADEEWEETSETPEPAKRRTRKGRPRS